MRLSKLFVLLLALPAYAEPDLDKQLHFSVSYSINTTLLMAMPKYTEYRLLKAAALTTAVGVAKEASDSEFSREDLLADVLGVVTSSAFAIVFEF